MGMRSMSKLFASFGIGLLPIVCTFAQIERPVRLPDVEFPTQDAVKAAIDNRDGRLRPGLFARVDLGISERSGVTMVPEDAILQRADGSVLFLMDGTDRVRRLRVATGAYLDTLVEVVGGIKADDQVVVRGQAELLNGSRVSLRNADGSPAGPSTKTVDSRPPSPQGTEKTGAGG